MKPIEVVFETEQVAILVIHKTVGKSANQIPDRILKAAKIWNSRGNGRDVTKFLRVKGYDNGTAYISILRSVLPDLFPYHSTVKRKDDGR